MSDDRPIARLPSAEVTPRSLTLLTCLVGLGLAQLASVVYLLRASRDFLLAKAESSTEAGDIAVPGEVFLGSDGCVACLRSGWSGPLIFGALSHRPDAVLALRLPSGVDRDARDLVVEFDAIALVPRTIEERRVVVLANGVGAGQLEFSRAASDLERFATGGEPVLTRVIVPHAVLARSPILLLALQGASIASERRLGAGANPLPTGTIVRRLRVRFADGSR